ncbi:20644_t:CDS:2, partial [Cetraspora pellucida]
CLVAMSYCLTCNTREYKQFSDAIYILSQKVNVDKINIDIAKFLETQLLLTKNMHIMLKTNLYMKLGVVNSALEIVYNILSEDN